MDRGFYLPKWAVVLTTACLFCPLAVDWVTPGTGLHLASVWLGGASGVRALPSWGWFVRLAGKNITALTTVSVCAGLVCVWFVAAIVGQVFDAAIRHSKANDEKELGGYRLVRNAAVLLAGLAFALTPGFLLASTRLSPLMVGFAPYLAAVWLIVCVLFGGGGSADDVQSGNRLDSHEKWRSRILWTVLVAFVLAVLLVIYSTGAFFRATHAIRDELFPALYVWLAVGLAPALMIAWRVGKHHLLGRWTRFSAIAVWMVAIAVMGATNVTLRKLGAGRVSNRVVAHMLANAAKKGHVAILSEGPLDDLLFMLKPDELRLVTFARARDRAYARNLADWIKRTPVVRPEHVEDLVFAAELGPGVLIDEWNDLDRTGFESSVATLANVFSTREEWSAACAEIRSMRRKEPLGDYIRRLLAKSGNALGCRLLEQGDDAGKNEAWAVFRSLVEEIEPQNYAAYLNLEGMIRRGYPVSQDERSELSKLQKRFAKGVKDWTQAVRVARKGGPIYVDPEEKAKFEQGRREEAAKRKPSSDQERFVQTLAQAAKSPNHGRAAQTAIRRALLEGKVSPERFGAPLITLDLALGDIANAEKDAFAVLMYDRHSPTANAALGGIFAARGQYNRAERFLRRAIATGQATVAAVNDLAYVYCRLGRLDEAEDLARAAVEQNGQYWSFHETLASILIRKGELVEGEREFLKAEELSACVHFFSGRIVSLELDRARLCKAKGDRPGFEATILQLRDRKNLTASEKAELQEIGKELQ